MTHTKRLNGSLCQRALSYLRPVTLAQATGPFGGNLELMLSCGEFVLLADGVVYSHGRSYLPAVTIADHLRGELPALRSVLALGVGLGSIVRVMRARGLCLRYTLVERDRTVLGWAMATLGSQQHAEVLEPVCQDAEAFMEENQRGFDLVFVDVFKGRKVPSFVTTPLFLRRCRRSLAPGGRMALNYLADDERRWAKLRGVLVGVFPDAEILCVGDHRILVARAPMG